MNPLVRAQLAAWARRYRTVAAGALAFLVLVVALPSVVPPADDADASGGFSAAAPAPDVLGELALPQVPAGASPFMGSVAAPVPSPPLTDAVNDGPGPPAPVDPVPPPGPGVECPAPLPPPEREAEPVPLADVLNLASPVLPLLGPFLPMGLAGLPLVEPALPVVTPLLPLGEPVYVYVGPIFTAIGGPLSEVSALLIQPVDEAMAPFVPQMLESEKAFIAMLQPVIDQATATGAFTCGAILTASLSGLIADYLMARD